MLTAIIRDFARVPGAAVATTMDRRELSSSFETAAPSVAVHPVADAAEARSRFDELAAESDASIVIAPETDGTLESWIGRLDALGTRNLGSSRAAIALASDKIATHERLAAAGIPSVPSVPLGRQIPPFPPPWIVKPRDGAGCVSTRVVRTARELRSIARGRGLVLTPFVPGVSASVSVLCGSAATVPLVPGEQFIRGERELTYAGGRLPLPPPLARRASDLACSAAASIAGLRGFIGVDLVLGDEDRVIEVNPRVTTSYVALRELAHANLAAAWLALDRGESPDLDWRDDRIRFTHEGEIEFEFGPERERTELLATPGTRLDSSRWQVGNPR